MNFISFYRKVKIKQLNGENTDFSFRPWIRLTKAGFKVKVDNVECRYKLEIVYFYISDFLGCLQNEDKMGVFYCSGSIFCLSD